MDKIQKELQPYIADLVKNAMLVVWDDICADSHCHPLDIEQNFEGRPGHLGFKPAHWAQRTGEMVAEQIKRFHETSRKERAKKIGRFVMTGDPDVLT